MGGKRIRRGQHFLCGIACLYFIGLMLSFSPVLAQVTVQNASILTVIYEGVELRRANTDTWLPIKANAVMPFGAGDTVRTYDNGRVLLTDVSAQTLILPFSEYTIVQATPDQFIGHLQSGEIIYQHITTDYEAVAIQLGEQSAVIPADNPVHLLLRFDPEKQNTAYLLSAAGTSIFADFELHANSAILSNQTSGEAVILNDLTRPFNPAEIIGLLEGCAGLTQTQSGKNLNARIGPGVINAQLGQFPNMANIQVMGIVESGGWYRVQFQSGFGWVERLAASIIELECDLPVLPDSAFDLPRRIFDAAGYEIEMLEPFYGTPDYDPIFYRQTA